MTERFDNIEFARAACKTNHLSILKIPKAALLSVRIDEKDIPVLIEEKLDLLEMSFDNTTVTEFEKMNSPRLSSN